MCKQANLKTSTILQQGATCKVLQIRSSVGGVMMVMVMILSLCFRHVWEKEGAPINVHSFPRMRLDPDGTLHISQTWSGDIGTYTCRVTSVGGNDSRSAYLRVR